MLFRVLLLVLSILGISGISGVSGHIPDELQTQNGVDHYTQEWKRNRITYDPSGVIRVIMGPGDGDGNTMASRAKAGRQRNEINLRCDRYMTKVNAKREYEIDLKFKQDIIKLWPVPVTRHEFYHVVQLKLVIRSTIPLFTVGILKGHLAVYNCDKNLKSALLFVPKKDEMIHVKVAVHNVSNGRISYTINGHKGSYTCHQLGRAPLVLKFGQYRHFPNPIKTTTEVDFFHININNK